MTSRIGQLSPRQLVRWFGLVFLLVLTSCNRGTARPSVAEPPAFALTAKTTAQDIPYPFENGELSFDHIGLEEGLSQSTVYAMLQDSDGYMWFATEDGLNRFDGYQMTVFRHDVLDPNSLSRNFIWTLHEDREGTLWIGTEGGGLDRFDRDTEQFAHYRHAQGDPTTLSSDYVKAIHEDKAGNLWIGTRDGFNLLDRTSGTFQRFTLGPTPPEALYSRDFIMDITEDADGRIWLGTLGGLFYFDTERRIFQRQEVDVAVPGSDIIVAIYRDDRNRLWLGSFNGLHRLNPSTGRLVHYYHDPEDGNSISDNFIPAITQDKAGTIWVGTNLGLDRLLPGSSAFIHHSHDPLRLDSLSDGGVLSLTVDRSGILWVGTQIGGTDKFDPYKGKFDWLGSAPNRPDSSLSHPYVWAILKGKDGGLWVGTREGLNHVDPDTGAVESFYAIENDPSSLSSNVIRSITQDRDGFLWVGTEAGLNRIDLVSHSIARYLPRFGDPNGLPAAVVSAVLEDSTGTLWVGTAGGGIAALDRSTSQFKSFTYEEVGAITTTLSENTVTCLLETRDGDFWVGTYGGLAQFDRESGALEFLRYVEGDANSLSNNTVLTLHEDSAERLWVGTADGLNRYDRATGRFHSYQEGAGLENDVINGILEDENGRLWLSTNRGIVRFDPDTEQFRGYDTSDGIRALEFVAGSHFGPEDGRMYFGSVNGLTSFHPGEIVDNPYVPPVVITDFRIQNESVPVGPDSRLPRTIGRMDSLALSRQDTVFSFELAALHYGAPHENQYAYVMEGFDEQWNFVGNRRFATYTNLPPGSYTFRAIGSNADGVWNPVGTSLQIVMPYPFWRTWWFALLATSAVLGVALGGYRWRIRRVEAHTRELQRQVNERTSEIERRRQIAEGLKDILTILNSRRSLEESLTFIANQAAELTDATYVSIFQCSRLGPLTLVANSPADDSPSSSDGPFIPPIQQWARESLVDRKPLVLPDLASSFPIDSRAHRSWLANHRAALCVPLYLGDSLYGGLIMFYARERVFTDEDLELGSTFAEQAVLAIANEQLREQVELAAVASERNRLARDLHDAVTQTLFSASLIAEALPALWKTRQEDGIQLVGELRQLTRGALAEMRTLLLELRPAALEEAALGDLLQQLAEAVTGRTGIPVSVDVDCMREMPTNVRIALYRIAQESLNNVMKHARADEVTVRLLGQSADDPVVLSVQDNGRGFDASAASPGSLGLQIIGERAEAIGASLSVESKKGKGTVVKAVWPGGVAIRREAER